MKLSHLTSARIIRPDAPAIVLERDCTLEFNVTFDRQLGPVPMVNVSSCTEREKPIEEFQLVVSATTGEVKKSSIPTPVVPKFEQAAGGDQEGSSEPEEGEGEEVSQPSGGEEPKNT